MIMMGMVMLTTVIMVSTKPYYVLLNNSGKSILKFERKRLKFFFSYEIQQA